MRRANYRLKSDDRILYIRLSAIGDVVNAIPGLVALRKSYPDSYIAWCVEELSADILRDHPCLDELLVIPTAWRHSLLSPRSMREIYRLVKRLRGMQFDIAIDAAQNLFKSGLVSWLSGAPRRAAISSKKDSEGHRKFHNLFIDPPRAMGPAAVNRAQFLEVLGAEVTKLEYVLPPIQAQHEEVSDLLKAAGIEPADLTLAINPCASRTNKQWPGEYFVALVRNLTTMHGAKIIWTGALNERAYIQGLADQISEPTLNLAGMLDLRQLAALYQQINLLVTGDTGPMHIGAAAGVFVVAIMASTNPRYHGPYTEHKRILTAGLDCQYCGRRQCPNRMECLTELKPDRVIEEAGALIRARAWEW